jgi:hypothetical protein
MVPNRNHSLAVLETANRNRYRRCTGCGAGPTLQARRSARGAPPALHMGKAALLGRLMLAVLQASTSCMNAWTVFARDRGDNPASEQRFDGALDATSIGNLVCLPSSQRDGASSGVRPRHQQSRGRITPKLCERAARLTAAGSALLATSPNRRRASSLALSGVQGAPANRKPALAAFLAAIEKDVRNRLAALAPRAETRKRGIPNERAARRSRCLCRAPYATRRRPARS